MPRLDPMTGDISGGDQAGRRRRDVTAIQSRNSGVSVRSDAEAALRALLARPVREPDAAVSLALVVRQIRWRVKRGMGAVVPREERVLRDLIDAALGSRDRRAAGARATLTAYIGNPNLFNMAETIRGLVEEGRSMPERPGASPGSASHEPEDVAARRVKWVATKPRVSKTMRIGGLVDASAGEGDSVTEHLYNMLPLTRNHAISALTPAHGAPRGEAARQKAWQDKVHEVYSGHVNGVIELPRQQARNFGWTVALRENVPRDAEDEAPRRRKARPGKSFDALLREVTEGRASGGGGSGGSNDDGGDEAPEVARLQAVLGGLRALQYITSKLGEDDAGRISVLKAAAANVTRLAERAVQAAAGTAEAQRAEHVTATRNNIMWGAVQQAAIDRAGRGRAAHVRGAAAEMVRSARGTPEPHTAWRLLDDVAM